MRPMRKRPPGPGDGVKIGRRLVTLPGMRSPRDTVPAAPTKKSDSGEPEQLADELSEELIRTIKAAYQ
jgi:hypothetical protein